MAACGCSTSNGGTAPAVQPVRGTADVFKLFEGEAASTDATRVDTPPARSTLPGVGITLSLEWIIIIGLAIALLFCRKG